MPTPPEGAQLSDDGHYWWDGQNWQLVEGGPAAGGGAGDANGSSGTTGAGDAVANPAAADSQWPPAGYPSDPAEWTQEQLEYWFGNTRDESQDVALAGDPVQVVAIAELESNPNEGVG